MKYGEIFLKYYLPAGPDAIILRPRFRRGVRREQGAGSRERKSEVGAQGSGGVNFGRLALAGRGFFDIGVEENAEKLKF